MHHHCKANVGKINSSKRNNKQEALLWQRDRARHLSVEILQLQNISLEIPIVWHYLRNSTFSRFDTIPECDRHTHGQTDRHTTTAYTALSIALRGKNRPYCTAHQLQLGPTTASNERQSIAKCTVIITYLNDNAQTPLNRLVVYMSYSQLCNTYGDKSDRWRLGLL